MLSVAWRGEGGEGGKPPVRGMRWKLQVYLYLYP
jgi:hypothetical protein